MSEQKKTFIPSILPSVNYYIQREDEIRVLESFIEKTEGAVIGLTGVRGSGKTTIMDKIIHKYQNDYFALKITSPTGYDETEFFVMVFKRICEEVNRKIEKEFGIRKTIEDIGKKENRKRLLLLLFGLVSPFLIYLWLFISENLYIIRIIYPISLSLLLFVEFFLLFVFKSKFFSRRSRKKFGLYRKTQEILEILIYEKTISYQAEKKAGIFEQLTVFFKYGKMLKTRPFTLPGLTSEYKDYVSDVTDVFGGKVIICIDELDKIVDPEEVKKLLRGIKGAIFQKNCYYLISISEDAVRTFRTRVSTERDMLESTFDEIINLERANLDISRKIVLRWLNYEENNEPSQEIKKTVDIISVLSGGVPRELIRNLRVVYMASIKNFSPIEAWKVLFKKKICNFRNEVKLTSLGENMKTEIYEVVEQLTPDSAFTRHIKLKEEVEEIYEALETWSSNEKEKMTQKKEKKEDLVKETERLQKIVLELEIYAVMLEYLKKNLSRNEEFLYTLLKAYSMLPYNKQLSNKYINDAILLLN